MFVFVWGGRFAKVAKDVVVIKGDKLPADTAGDDMVGLVLSWVWIFLSRVVLSCLCLFGLVWLILCLVLRLIFSDDLS